MNARILRIANVTDDAPFLSSVADKLFPAVSDEASRCMQKTIAEAHSEGDSVGGIVECVVRGVPAGLGNPIFDGVENRIAQLMFAVPAVKGIEFGAGFAAAEMHGSENNDEFCIQNGSIHTCTNHAGGILGGITNGEEIVFRVAFKPTPSIAKPQRSVNLESMQPEILEITGRHDPCIVPRAVPVVEAVAAVSLSDLILRGNDTWN